MMFDGISMRAEYEHNGTYVPKMPVFGQICNTSDMEAVERLWLSLDQCIDMYVAFFCIERERDFFKNFSYCRIECSSIQCKHAYQFRKCFMARSHYDLG